MWTLQSGSLELKYLMESCSLSFILKLLGEAYKRYLNPKERCQLGVVSLPLSCPMYNQQIYKCQVFGTSHRFISLRMTLSRRVHSKILNLPTPPPTRKAKVGKLEFFTVSSYELKVLTEPYFVLDAIAVLYRHFLT